MTKRSDPLVSQKLEQYVTLREAVWLWDAHNGQIMWANNPGLVFWDENDLAKLKVRHFDHAMPGIAKIHALAGQESFPVDYTESFLFWTESGPKNIECQCVRVSVEGGYSGLLLIAQKRNDYEVLEEFSPDLSDQSLAEVSEVDTTFENTLSSPEDQETLKEIAKLLAKPEDGLEESEEPLTQEFTSETLPTVSSMNGRSVEPKIFEVGLTASEIPENPFEENTYVSASPSETKKPVESRGPFLARVGNEVRIPLNSIIGFAELMRDEKHGALGHPKYRGYVEDILDSAYHALGLMNDFLEISQARSGLLPLSPIELDLNGVIEACISSLQPQTNQARLVIRQSLSANLPKITADMRSMRQAVLNLLSNAIKFTAAGGQIIVSTQLLEDSRVRLRVRDNGIGMTEDDLQAAMEPFDDAGSAIASGIDLTNGAGLRLPLTKALIEANGAVFHLSSEEGKGTLAEVILPL